LLHLGETAAASDLLYGALEHALRGGYQSLAWRIRCSLGELLLATGAPEQAKVSLSALLEELNAAELRATLFRARHALYRACRVLGEDALALQHLEAYQSLERARSTRQLRAQSQLFITRLEAEQSRLQAERARLEAQIARTRAAEFEAHALRDQLTGLANRRHLDAQLPGLLELADDQDLPLTLAMVDVDHFKAINDRFGHAVGDRVLVTLAQLLRENTRGSDLVARIGGEEFVIALPEAPPARAHEVCERLRARVAAHAWGQLAEGLQVTLSLGLAHAPPYAQAPLLERADAAMYRAKQLGRNQVAIA
jgi:diguanylate cyclase (GGDEF)-like protein